MVFLITNHTGKADRKRCGDLAFMDQQGPCRVCFLHLLYKAAGGLRVDGLLLSDPSLSPNLLNWKVFCAESWPSALQLH